MLSRISTTMIFLFCLHHWFFLPPPISWSNNTPSGWQLFPIDVCPVCCHPYNPFRHLIRPTYHMLPSHLSSTALNIPVVLNLRHRVLPRSVSFCNTLLVLICSTLLFSLSALIFSLQFYFLFWKNSSLSPWYSCSAMICHVFHYFSSLCSDPIWSFPSTLSAPIHFIHIWSDQLLLILS